MPLQRVIIENENFDPPFTRRRDPYVDKGEEGVLTVANGWDINYIPRKAGEGEEVNRRPEWREFGGHQKMFVGFGTTRAVLMQTVLVNAGDVLTLNARAAYSAIEAGLSLVVGICPYAQHDFLSPDVVWGRWQGETAKGVDHWPNPGPNKISTPRTLTCEGVKAVNDWVTIFLRMENLFPGRDVSSFWHQAQLFKLVVDDPVPEPPDPPEASDLVAAILEVAAAIRSLKG